MFGVRLFVIGFLILNAVCILLSNPNRKTNRLRVFWNDKSNNRAENGSTQDNLTPSNGKIQDSLTPSNKSTQNVLAPSNGSTQKILTPLIGPTQYSLIPSNGTTQYGLIPSNGTTQYGLTPTNGPTQYNLTPTKVQISWNNTGQDLSTDNVHMIQSPLPIPQQITPTERYLFRQPHHRRYDADWKSLDTRVSPTWYDEAKIGVFVHWGVYSVPAFGTSNQWDGYAEWFLFEWKGKENKDFIDFMEKHYPADFKYSDFASSWKAEFFDPQEWADLIEESGAKYFIATTKHHDGFTLWPSNVSWNWNAADTGPHRDLIADLSKAIRSKKDIHFGLYYSLFEWYHPLYLFDKKNNFKTQEYVKKVLFPQMYDYVNRYKPEYIWSDGDWEASYEYWNSTEFIAWLYNDSPVREQVLVNDRWGIGANCEHGDVKTCGIDRFNPHFIQKFKWENAMTIDHHSWGFRRNAPLSDYLTMYNLTSILAETISCGGNMVMNIGPTADGRIVPIFQERLRQMGAWLKVNGEGIYASKPWRIQNDTSDGKIWYTYKKGIVYAIVLEWPDDGWVILEHPIPTAETKVFLLGYEREIPWMLQGKDAGFAIDVSSIGVRDLPCEWAWTIKLMFVE